MSKGNLFLGYARGKVGDVVFSRQSGEQIARARNRSPKNPQSALQMLQRVIMKTNSAAYSMLQNICNHSFQGRQEGTKNQSRFSELNVAAMRRQLAELINSGDPEEILTSTEYNFAGKYSSLAQIRPYIVSEGTIPSLNVAFTGVAPELAAPGILSTTIPTYQEVCDALGLQQGDQLTFLCLTCNDYLGSESSEFNGFRYARVILEPSDGDMSKPFLVLGEHDEKTVNLPNAANEGKVFIYNGAVKLTFNVDGTEPTQGTDNTIAGAAVIASRLSGGVWQRSSQSLVIPADASFGVDHNIGYLYDAIYSFLTGTNSSLYLNQAEGF